MNSKRVGVLRASATLTAARGLGTAFFAGCAAVDAAVATSAARDKQNKDGVKARMIILR
jgi:hypothetical protein